MKHNPRVLSYQSEGELRAEIERIGATPAGAELMCEKATRQVVRLEQVPGQAAGILKQEMLAHGGEAALSRSVAAFDRSPQPVILLGTLRQYQEVAKVLARQPFGLPALGEELLLTLKRYAATPCPLRCHDREIPLGTKTLVMGILNVTPNSFSGDGLEGNVEQALRQAEQFAAEGADLLDIGGESTRPGSEPVSAEEELARVRPCLERLLGAVKLPISVDTSKPQVARAALEAGAHINDIGGLGEAGMIEVAAEFRAPVILMHMQGAPRDMQQDPHYEDLMTEVYGFLVERTEAAIAGGVAEAQIVIDPGLGFGKTAEHNLELIRQLRELRSLGRPVLIGPSRKATIGKVLGKEPGERQWGTAALVAAGIMNGADIVRVHDVAEMAQVARMTDAVARGWEEDA